MNRVLKVTFGGALFASASLSYAANIAVSPQLSFPKGPGIEVTTKLNSHLNGRVGLNALTLSADFELDQIDYTADVNLRSFSVLADWHPYAGSFRLSLGMMINQSNFKVSASSSDSYQIGNETYNGDLSLNGQINFRPVAPYFGLGWGNAVSAGKRWGFNMDVGILMAGQMKIGMDASGVVSDSSGNSIDVSNESVFQENLAKEVASIQEDLDAIKILPLLSASVSYKF